MRNLSRSINRHSDPLTLIIAIVVCLLIVAGAWALSALVIRWLWNWLIVDFTGLRAISFWEALGVSFIIGILKPVASHRKD